MDKYFRRYLIILERLPRNFLWMVILLITILLGLLDYQTGFEFSFAFFYLLPVTLAAWTINRLAGFVISIVSAFVWLFSNLMAGEQYSSPLIPLWNAVTRLGFFFIVTWLLAELRQLLEHERLLAKTDFLTGILNRRAFYAYITEEIARSRRYQHPFTILYVDIDNFKLINDNFGHSSGDRLLQVVAQTIKHEIRLSDRVARLGGDEFAVLFPETNAIAAKDIVPRLRQTLLMEMKNNQWPITFSIGALTCQQTPPDNEELIRLADQLMYTVKNTSKDDIAYSVYSG